MLIINDTLGTYGGSITLIERLCTWAVMNNECIKVYCNDMSNKEIVTKLNRMNVTIECFDTYDSKALSLHIYEDLKQGDIQIVSFILNNYLSIEAVKKSHDLDFVNVIYSIHPATFYKGTGIKEGTFKSVILKRYKKTVQRINDNGAIIFMDQDNIESAEKYYGFSFNSPTVIRALPMICTPLGEDELRSKISKSYDKKIIFTSCRADFPFKGYLFGLIEDFAELAHKYPDVKLCVVCSGEQDDVQKVKTKIKGYDEYVRSRIEFHDWMKYEDLLELMSQAYLYIGMGTGVLDAAIKYVPSIAVRYNTYYNLADCILCDRPDYVVAEERCKSKALSLIEYLLSLDLVEYSKISKKCFEEVAKIYDIQSFFECIKGLEKKKSYLTGIDIFIHSINTVLNSFKRKKHYDVSNIKYEGGE